MDRQQEVLAALQPLYSGDGHGAKRLLVHAICESKKFAWRTSGQEGTRRRKADSSSQTETVLAKGVSPEDLVGDGIDLTVKGKRAWNRTKYPNILNHLKWVITGLVQNLASSWDNKTFRPMPEDREGRPRDEMLPVEQPTEAAPDGNPNGSGDGDTVVDGTPPEAMALRAVAGPGAGYFVDEIYKAVGDDEQLAEVLLHLAEGKKPRQIMKDMNLPDADVYRLTQKLRRRIAPILDAKA